MAVDYLLAEDLVCLLLHGESVCLGIDGEVVIEYIEEDAIVLFFGGVVGEESQ